MCNQRRTVKKEMQETYTTPQKGCRTFCVCCINCFGFYFEQNLFQFGSLDVTNVLHRIFNANLTSSFLSDCFHPPEMGLLESRY